MLGDAGLGSVRIETLEDRLEYDSVESWLEMTIRLAGPVRALMSRRDGADRDAIARRMAAGSEPFRQDDGRLVLPELMLGATATRA